MQVALTTLVFRPRSELIPLDSLIGLHEHAPHSSGVKIGSETGLGPGRPYSTSENPTTHHVIQSLRSLYLRQLFSKTLKVLIYVM